MVQTPNQSTPVKLIFEQGLKGFCLGLTLEVAEHLGERLVARLVRDLLAALDVVHGVFP